MAYLLSNIYTKNYTGIGQLLLKLSLVVGWYPFLRHSVQELCIAVERVRGRPGPWSASTACIQLPTSADLSRTAESRL